MNNQRRKEIEDIRSKIITIKRALKQICSDEKEYYGGFAENMRESEKAKVSEKTINVLNTTVGHLDEALKCLENK